MNTNQAFKSIKLERTMCFGSCPVYKVSIHHSGRVTYTGEMFVEQEGRHVWYIDQTAINKLNKALKKCDYFNLEKENGIPWCTDLPFCNTMVEMQDGTKRKIEHYLNEPDEWPMALRRFEEQVDTIIGVKKYVGNRR